jgi:asparaginyl-tRNA synthetase
MISKISDIGQHVGQTVTLQGWMYNRRSGKNIHFLQLRDGSGMIQGVCVQAEVPPEVWDAAGKMTMESSCRITGTVREDKRSPSGFELTVTGVEVIHTAEEYPISKKEHGPDFLLDHRHLWLRSSKQWALMRVRSVIIKACRDFLDEQGFVCIDAPVFTPNACEGTTNLFEVDYFDSKAYLTQSGQLYMEAAAMAHGRVYCFGPAFRAEKSKTRKHLTEFWMVEPEVAFLELDGLMELMEQFVVFIVGRCLERRKEDLKILGRNLAPLERVKAPFPRIHYNDALERIRKNGVEIPWGEDFGAPHEEALMKDFEAPALVHRFPSQVKAFYMEPDPQDPKHALACDLLAPEGYGELIGGSQRIHDLALLEKRIAEHKLPREAFDWYLDLRRYGTVPHSGFGLGVERTVAWISGSEHIRECIPFPRMLYKIYP